MYGYKRTTIKYTIALVSYTSRTSLKNERIKERLVKVNGYNCYNKFELKKYLESNCNMDKVFVHEIKENYYWEE